jgi:hypothetical protein
MPDWQRLPERLRHDPHITDMRLSAVEQQTHENTAELDRRHGILADVMRQEVKTPLGSLPLPIAISGAALLVYLKPDLLLRFLGQ